MAQGDVVGCEVAAKWLGDVVPAGGPVDAHDGVEAVLYCPWRIARPVLAGVANYCAGAELRDDLIARGGVGVSQDDVGDEVFPPLCKLFEREHETKRAETGLFLRTSGAGAGLAARATVAQEPGLGEEMEVSLGVGKVSRVRSESME